MVTAGFELFNYDQMLLSIGEMGKTVEEMI